VIGINDVAIQ